MKKCFLILSIIYASSYLLTSCANITPPTGGPRDTIAPVRILTIPLDKTINYKGQTIELEFDERIKTDKIKDQLIITPYTESDYEFTLKKNILKLEFEESFSDSTTYTLNFRESIQDITEGNPTEDNKFTFSTGSFIDSMSINGYVKDLLTYDTLENIVIGLYRVEDTITIFDGPPYYFTELEEDGSYFIENVKNGSYFIYAFIDDNKNLELETNSEKYGFSKDTISLDSGLYAKNIDLINLDLTEFKKMTALASGKYYDINLNKYIVDFDINPINNSHPFFTNKAKENKAIRFYNNFNDIDSLQISFTAIDSINSTISDTLYVKFSDSKRKSEDFNITITPEKNDAIETTLKTEIEFNKPILSINTDSMYIQYDTTIINTIHDSIFVWNKYRDKLSFTLDINKVKADTILSRKNRLKQIQKDSIQKQKDDQPVVKKQMSGNKKEEGPRLNSGLQLYFGHGAFYSVEYDTSETIGMNYKFIIPEEYGTQEVKISSQYDSFTLQLTDEKFKIIRVIKDEKEIIFQNLKPGNYKIRVLIDANNDGKWSPGNMKKQIEPEPVYIYPEVITIRADWQTSLDITF